ncbi:MAG: PaaI family thioesterase [Pyrinomonadaceae bacterium]|nr:PaaI family thioesterase [Pyrinomonadaceae bacterium]
MTNEEKKNLAFETIKTTPYLKLLGIEAVEFETGKAVLSLEMQEKLRQPYGLLHGGATASLIDTATAFAVVSVLEADEKATTVDLTVQFLRPHTTGKIICTAKIQRAGKRLLFVSAEVVNEENKLIATALSTYTKV